MLTTSGDLIPVQPSAITIPWTRRKSQILNFLHRGPVTFSTLVYDTNVGDISALSAYFNPERISVKDLNSRFGQYPSSSGEDSRDENVKVGSENVVKPRLLLYPEHNLNHSQVKVQRTLKWVLSHQENEDSDKSRSSLSELHPPDAQHTSRPPSTDYYPFSASSSDLHRSVEGKDVFGDRGYLGPIERGPGIEFNPSVCNLSAENLQRPKGSMWMLRSGSVSSQNTVLTPIGEPVQEASQLRASTMPDLGNELDRALEAIGRGEPSDSSMPISMIDNQPMWGNWKPTETPW